MKIEKEVLFRSNAYDESADIKIVSIDLSDETISAIKKAQEIIKTTPISIESIKIKLNDSYEYINWESDKTSEWNDDGGYLLVYKHAVYFYAQCKYDSSSQIETEELKIN
jgi:hypothetical protein